jgi:predicted amidohydrolase
MVGLLIGWDLAFPEAARCLTLQGAELVCACANWEQPHGAEWRNYVFTRALENSLFVAAANRTGDEYTYSFLGSSLIVGPDGRTHSAMEEGVEGYGLATIDLDEVRQNREDTQLLQVRRPRSYRDIVKMY